MTCGRCEELEARLREVEIERDALAQLGGRTGRHGRYLSRSPAALPIDAFRQRKQKAFWSQVEKTCDCWLWRGSVQNGGYGIVRFVHEGCLYVLRAHRAAFVLAHGRSPQPGLVLRHTCDSKLCVRPEHLLEGTQSDNVADRHARGRDQRGASHYNAKLTEAQVLEIRRRAQAGERACCSKVRTGTGWACCLSHTFRITGQYVSRIKNGHCWRWLPPEVVTSGEWPNGQKPQ